MTKLVSILTSVLILFQGFNIHFDDLMELDELIEHAQFHSETYGDNFLVFLSKHYGELKAEHAQKNQEERQEHEELPFQHQCQTASISVFVLNDPLSYPEPKEPVVNNSVNFVYQVSSSTFQKEGPFQPPRQV